MADYEVMNNLGDKVVVRAKCCICNGEFLDTIRQNSKDKNKSFYCDMCEEEKDLHSD